MRRIKSVIRKEFRQVFRDRPMLFLIFGVPVVQLVLLSFAITTEVKHVKLLVADLDESAVSREIVGAFARATVSTWWGLLATSAASGGHGAGGRRWDSSFRPVLSGPAPT
jgi:hypothetical protein